MSKSISLDTLQKLTCAVTYDNLEEVIRKAYS